MVKIIDYDDIDQEYNTAVMVDKIVRLTKDKEDINITYIHLTTGEILRSADSIRTLMARINSDA